LPATIAVLEKFKRFWEVMEHKNEIDADDDDDIGMVLEQGSFCLRIVDMVLPIYALYTKKALSWEEYVDRVALLMRSEASAANGSH
jgi:hypothetical protein